ncbi:MAG: hypothetical protein IH886_09705 [Nitrospinae bacterium]|nr:hypothetical protein [Nitrospinota bacterium]
MKTLVIAIFAGVAIFFLNTYYFGKGPNLKYVLSESLPIGETESGQEIIGQQIEVINAGDLEAEDIFIRFPRRVESYKITKNLLVDKVEVIQNEEIFELHYPNLPIDGKFKIVLKILNFPIRDDVLLIGHKNGKAINALIDEAESKWDLIKLIFLFSLIFLVWIAILGIFVDSLVNKALIYPEKFLKKKRPSYINEEKWKEIRSSALDRIALDLRKYYYGKIHEVKAYLFLNKNKPDELDVEEWDKLKSIATDALEEIISNNVLLIHRLKEFSYYFTLEKPTHLIEIDWVKIKDKINESYFLLVINELLSAYDKISAYPNEKPEGIENEKWERLLRQCREICIADLLDKVSYNRSPIQFLNGFNIDVLGSEYKDRLLSIAYKIEISFLPDFSDPIEAKKFLNMDKPDWMNDEDFDKRKSIAQKVVILDAQESRYMELNSLFNRVSKFNEVWEEKSDAISEQDWENILKINSRIIKRDKDLVKKEKELIALETEVKTLKDKIERQLNIINDCFDNPSKLEKIEEYNNPFAPGNFETLKKVAQWKKGTSKKKS